MSIKTDKQWEVENDAATIRHSGELASDKRRFGLAKRYLEEESKRAKLILDSKIWSKVRKMR